MKVERRVERGTGNLGGTTAKAWPTASEQRDVQSVSGRRAGAPLATPFPKPGHRPGDRELNVVTNDSSEASAAASVRIRLQKCAGDCTRTSAPPEPGRWPERLRRFASRAEADY